LDNEVFDIIDARYIHEVCFILQNMVYY